VAGTLDTGETVVVGHDDYALAPVAKGWLAGPTPPTDEVIILDAERHAIAVLDEARMRNVGIADPPEPASEEGFVQFVSPTGQILAVDVAPTGWFDPEVPRFLTGATTVEMIDGVQVRVTEPTEGDNLGFTRGAEFGWACDGFVWILEPPFNGDADEMRQSVGAIVTTDECAAA